MNGTGSFGCGGEALLLRAERPCGTLEFHVRRVYTSLFYWRLYKRLRPGWPHLAPGANHLLARLIGPQSVVFEWGSGTSTLWFSQRARELHSVEHDARWYDRTARDLQTSGRRDVHLTLCESFDAYARAICGFPDECFDVIVVDGRHRVECFRNALPKLRAGGRLVLDDSHRPRYAPCFELMRGQPRRRFDFGILQTTVFCKGGVA